MVGIPCLHWGFIMEKKTVLVPAFLLSESATDILERKLKRALDDISDFKLIRNSDEELIITDHAVGSVLALKEELEKLDMENVSRSY